MHTKVVKPTLDVNRKPDDSGTGPLQPEDVAAQKQATLVQRLQAVVDAKMVKSFNDWCETAGVSRGAVSTFMKRFGSNPETDIGFRTLTRLADAAGLSRQWLFVGATFTPERAGAEDRVVRSLLGVIDSVVGAPKEDASNAENARAFADAVAMSISSKAVDEGARAIQSARALFEAGRVDTKKGWLSVIDRLSERDLVDATATADDLLKARLADSRPDREHAAEPATDQIFEPKVTPATPIGPASKSTERAAKKGRARR